MRPTLYVHLAVVNNALGDLDKPFLLPVEGKLTYTYLREMLIIV